ncbi:MAG: UDP-N-acetylmuramoyl-L-alanine--D-glutamate ligase [Actinobacteria bacterium]|nr:UDP-N-acetylmuramoyl-L-alanine--D-glutamate ligase [Actinomycetota bacterium]
MIDLKEKNILVVGFGDSGYESSKVARRIGAKVTVIDSAVHPAKESLLTEIEGMGIKTGFGIGVPDDLDEYDLVITSPGVPDHADVIVQARKADRRIISELEFGYRMLKNEMVAVTGTNGKTTTTRLIAQIMDSPSRRAVTCGNIGKPLVSLYGSVKPEDLLVVEVSSFQLRNIERFGAHVTVVLNIAPDHYDWHSDFGDYKSAKMRIVENTRENDYLVYNLDDESCREMARRAGGKTVGFSLAPVPDAGVWLEDGWIVAGEPFNIGKIMRTSEIKLRGIHNTVNVMAAVGSALALGEAPLEIRKSVAVFEPIEHRTEFADEISGVTFINDSKATNPHAALHAIKSFNGPLVAILGGRNKGLDFSELALEVNRRIGDGVIIGVILLGESADEIAEALTAEGNEDVEKVISKASDLDGSVVKAFEITGGNGTVLFSPACASFDMFRDYKDRGTAFKRAVNLLKGRVERGPGQ